MILIDGKIVSTSEQVKTVTVAEYNALTEEERNDGTSYYVSDYDDTEYKKLIKVGNVIGSDEKLSGYADGTIVGAIVDLYNRLGGISLSLGVNDEVIFDYDDTTPTPVTSPDAPKEMTDLEKIEHYQKVIGNETDLNNLGFSNIVTAILNLYSRLNGVQFEYDATTSTFKMIYSDSNPK